MVQTFTLPDFIGACRFQVGMNPHFNDIGPVSDAWMVAHGVLDDPAVAERFNASQFSLLSAVAFPKADPVRFRLCCDYINVLFAFDDVEDDGDLKEDIAGTRIAVDLIMRALTAPDVVQTKFAPAEMLRQFWQRSCKIATPECQDRFVERMHRYTRAVYDQVLHRAAGGLPDMNSFIEMRRNTSALRPIWALVEFALDVDIPTEVITHPLLLSMGDHANDLVSWVNDVYSLNAEQSRGHYANLVFIVMKEQNLSLQRAVDFVGDMVFDTMRKFEEDKSNLPSWGPEIDAQVAEYVLGMEQWVVGSFEWSFASERYFGREHLNIKQTRVVEIWPREELVQPSSEFDL